MSDQPTQHPPAWHPDPFGRFDHRWWDGAQWTATVSKAGQQTTDPLGVQPGKVPTVATPQHKIVRQVEQQAGVDRAQQAGGGTILTEPVLVVNQKVKLLELNNEYAVFDQHGQQIGAVRQIGQSKGRKVLRALTNVDQFLTHKLEIVDMAGNPILRLTRPAKLIKSRVIVERPNGEPVGELIQQNAIGKIRFDIQAGGVSVGSLNAENWRAWDFHIADQTGTEVARVKKTWEGLAKTLFTSADNYVVRFNRPVDDPLRTLIVAAALTIDTALKQDDRGFN